VLDNTEYFHNMKSGVSSTPSGPTTTTFGDSSWITWAAVDVCELLGGGCARQFCTAVLSAGVECCELCEGMQGSGSSEYRSEENKTKIPNVCPHLVVESCGGRAVD